MSVTNILNLMHQNFCDRLPEIDLAALEIDPVDLDAIIDSCHLPDFSEGCWTAISSDGVVFEGANLMMTKIQPASFTDTRPGMSDAEYSAYRERNAARHSEARVTLKKLANEGTTLIWKINAASRLYDARQLPAGSIDDLAKELKAHQGKLASFVEYWRRNFPNPGDAWRWREVGGGQAGLHLESVLSQKDVNAEFSQRLSAAFSKVGGIWVPKQSA